MTNLDKAIKVYVRLTRSPTRTDTNVLLALRAGVVAGKPVDLVTPWTFDPERACAAVGDEYATLGRVRSQSIARMLRRAVDLGLAAPRRGGVAALTLTPLGREVAQMAALPDAPLRRYEGDGAKGDA